MGKRFDPDLALQFGIIGDERVVVAAVAGNGDLYPQL